MFDQLIIAIARRHHKVSQSSLDSTHNANCSISSPIPLNTFHHYDRFVLKYTNVKNTKLLMTVNLIQNLQVNPEIV